MALLRTGTQSAEKKNISSIMDDGTPRSTAIAMAKEITKASLLASNKVKKKTRPKSLGA